MDATKSDHTPGQEAVSTEVTNVKVTSSKFSVRGDASSHRHYSN